MMINKLPTAPGGAYTVTIALTPRFKSATGTITGQVNVIAGTGTAASRGKVRKLAVTAETIGTNTVIATAQIKPPVSKTAHPPGGCFTLTLPAAGPRRPQRRRLERSMTWRCPEERLLTPRAIAAAVARARRCRAHFQVTGNQTLGNITGTVSDGCVAEQNNCRGDAAFADAARTAVTDTKRRA